MFVVFFLFVPPHHHRFARKNDWSLDQSSVFVVVLQILSNLLTAFHHSMGNVPTAATQPP